MEKIKGKNLLRVLLGGAVGGANSFFGGGGGMIAVPLLQKTGMQEKEAHATAILLIFPISFLSFILYLVKGAYDFSVLIPTSIGVSIGGFLGAKLLCKMSIRAVRLCFALLQLVAGVWLVWF